MNECKNLTGQLIAIFCGMFFIANIHSAPLVFDSGSDGSDGVLDFSWAANLPAAERTIIFDPKNDATFDPDTGRVLDLNNDNVFHFTSILIPSGVTVILRADKLLWRPVYWLATGDITIESSSILNLKGADGHAATSVGNLRVPAMPGPGGFPGGLGASSVAMATAGYGPGAGLPASIDGGGGDAAHVTAGNNFSGTTGAIYGSPYLVPLVGGSGGAGDGNSTQTQPISRGGGGAGGGAIVLASSTLITNNGQINASGGYYLTRGGFGSGGAVRLMAPTIQGSTAGAILVRGGRSNTIRSNGRIRIEAFNNLLLNKLYPDNAGSVRVSGLVPTTPFLPPPTDSRVPGWPSVRVTSIAGVALPNFPTASFIVPDAEITAATDVPVIFTTNNIPTTANISLQIISSDAGVILATPTHSTGDNASSTWQALVTFPAGFSRGFVQATWTP